MGEVKEGQLKYNKERIRKTSHAMQSNREIKGGKPNIRKRNKNNTNKIKEVKVMKKIIIHINNKMPALWDSKVTFVSVSWVLGLALCSPFQSVTGPFVRRKKKGRGR